MLHVYGLHYMDVPVEVEEFMYEFSHLNPCRPRYAHLSLGKMTEVCATIPDGTIYVVMFMSAITIVGICLNMACPFVGNMLQNRTELSGHRIILRSIVDMLPRRSGSDSIV